MTRHHPISIPSGPRTGRECQWPQPGAPTSARLTRTQRVALRGGEHVGEQLAVGLLDDGALGERAAGLGDAGRERVADLLQLTEVEHARRPGGADPVRDVDPAHALGDQPAELQLELADLPAQLGARPRSSGRSSFVAPGRQTDAG